MKMTFVQFTAGAGRNPAPAAHLNKQEISPMDSETLTLGNENFPLGLFSDLHADTASLHELREREPAVKRWFCCGDYVDSRNFRDVNSEALKNCREWNILGVRGNHDNTVLSLYNKLDPSGAEFLYAQPDVLVLECPFGCMALFHGTPLSENAFCNRREMGQFVPFFKEHGWQYVFVGHTHESYSFSRDGVSVCNLGHLSRLTFGEQERTYALVNSQGEVTLKWL